MNQPPAKLYTLKQKWAGLRLSIIYTHTEVPTGGWWVFMEAESSAVCILSLDFHKKHFPLHKTLGHQVAYAQKEDFKTCFHTMRMKNLTWKSFRRCSWNTAFNVNTVFKMCNRGGGAFLSKAGIVPPANLSVNDLSVWCKRSPCNAQAGAGGRDGEKGGEGGEIARQKYF